MNELERFGGITTFIFDVDGVLTDSSLLVLEDGNLLRSVNVRDGYAIKRALQTGYRVAIITGGRSEGVRKRFEKLGVENVFLGAENKVAIYQQYRDDHALNDEEIMYMGDDLPDFEVMRLVGFPVCPRDACPEILALATYVSGVAGGAGCARDVIERVLRLRGDWLPSDAEEDLPTSV